MTSGFLYGNYLKSHNINPHTQGNQPPTYQTHRNAMTFAKNVVAKKQEERWRRLVLKLGKILGGRERGQLVEAIGKLAAGRKVVAREV